MAQTIKFITEYGIETVGLISISSGTAAEPGLYFVGDDNTGFFSPAANTLALSTDGTERFRISSAGAFGLAGANYGTSGQVLTSGGDNAAPTWTTPTTGTVTSVSISGGSTGLTTSGGAITSSGTITLGGTLAIANGGTGQTTANAALNAFLPSQTGNSGKYLTTDGTNTSWSVITSVSTLANTTTLGVTENTAVSFIGKTSTSGNAAPMTIAAGDSESTGNNLTLRGGTGGGANNGGSVTLRSGDSVSSGGYSGSVTVHADTIGISGGVTIRGGNSSGNGNGGGGGNLTLQAGDSTNASTGATTGNVTIRGGNATATTAGGSVTISGGTGPAGGGAIIFRTASTTSLADRMRISAGGDLGLGAVPAAYGESSKFTINATGKTNAIYINFNGTGDDKQISMANGNGVVGYVGTNDSSITFGTGLSTERLRITSAGAWGLAGANYGTSGQVLTSNGSGSAPTWQTVSGGGGASLPSQTGNSGKYLTTNGTDASWANPFASSVSFGARYDELSTTVTASATTTIDCSLGNNFVLSMAASITTLTLSNVPTSGRVFSLTLYVTQDAGGSKTIAWPGSVKWPSAAAPTLTTTGNKIDVLTLVTYDGGTSWLGFVAGQNF